MSAEARADLLSLHPCVACGSQGTLAGADAERVACSACGAHWPAAATPYLPDAVFWSATDKEQLSDQSVGDALSELFETTDASCWPAEVEVRAYRRMRPSGSVVERLAERLAEEVGEAFDEELADPDGWFQTHDRDKLRAQLQDLLERFEAEDYQAWACESFATVTVPLPSWLRKAGYGSDEDVAKYLAAQEVSVPPPPVPLGLHPEGMMQGWGVK